MQYDALLYKLALCSIVYSKDICMSSVTEFPTSTDCWRCIIIYTKSCRLNKSYHMTVPFSNLYHWVEGHYPDMGITYTFSPAGNRNLQNLEYFRVYDDTDRELYPEVICHDQEPLNFELYKDLDFELLQQLPGLDDQPVEIIQHLNLKAALLKCSIYDQVVLIHSEKNSQDLEKYSRSGFVGVHYWAHAIIARDWFRFACHDTRLKQEIDPKHKKRFLVYLREWEGSREYRLTFAKLVVNAELLSECNISIKHVGSQGQAPHEHQFKNPALALDNFEFVKSFNDNPTSSCVSADYDPADFVASCISVVLETVFDGSKIHLTEKILRPIACGHPFILAAGPGSLEYVRSYGFKTFSPWINEDYDSETNSVQRLQAIVTEMKRLSALTPDEFDKINLELHKIAKFNQERFFSVEFAEQVSNELMCNLAQAFEQVKFTRGSLFLTRTRPKVYKNPNKLKQKILKLKSLRRLSSGMSRSL